MSTSEIKLVHRQSIIRSLIPEAAEAGREEHSNETLLEDFIREMINLKTQQVVTY
jgi:hypothetical protein